MSRRRRWWFVYAMGSIVVLFAVTWISAAALRLEQRELAARAEAGRQDRLRLALWRMDSWLAPRLLREASRPYREYQPFPADSSGETTGGKASGAAATMRPSPLLTLRSDLFPLYFERTPDGSISSPQAPGDPEQRQAAIAYLDVAEIDASAARLSELAEMLASADLDRDVAAAETRLALLMNEPPVPAVPTPRGGPQQQMAQIDQSQQELTQRRNTYLSNVIDAQRPSWPGDTAGSAAADIGPLIPLWITPPEPSPHAELLFVRRVAAADGRRLQGFLCDWPTLRESLQGEIADLLPRATLLPRPSLAADDADEAGPTLLATVPVSLEVPSAIVAPAGLSPLRVTLAATWLAVLAGLAAAAVTLRATVAYGEKRSRFAASVTHELRTPLTTFRMYSEMLASGMVTDDAQRQSYLQTLHDESERLSRLVENVISYARLEDGRRSARTRELTTDQLLDEVLPPIERRADESDMTLAVDSSRAGADPVHVDADAIAQILFNLVDNACKYARNGHGASLALDVERVGRVLRFAVRDDGPGIAPGQARSIFAPFERGREADGDEPGLGLGLALARGLARDLGGDLEHVPNATGGACFVLTVPALPRT
ncbi:MAG: sensor histidine kinase [Planctomycetota bacterium]|jgi:signal transduction histidine kinase